MKVIGPTVPRWALGDELAAARHDAGLDFGQVAAGLDCSESKIRKIEAGQVGLRKLELDALVALYRLDDATHARLENLRALGARRGLYVRHASRLTKAESEFLGIESAALEIRTWQTGIPGLLQTEAYARTIARGWGASDDDADEYARIRMERQKLVWTDPAPTMWVVVDEGALRRTLGDPEMLADQLDRLLNPPESCHVQVLPATAPPHPGLAGPLTLFRFDPDMHTPIAYTETPAGVHFLEEDFDRAESALLTLSAMAASLPDSRRLIRASMDAVLASNGGIGVVHESRDHRSTVA